MIKNVAGQKIGCQMNSATDGSAFTSTVTVYVTLDAGTQAIGTVGSGVCTHEGNGYHTYAPSQAETNGDLVAFTFIGTGAIPQTVQCATGYPQSGDVYPLADTEIAAIKAKTDNLPSDPADASDIAASFTTVNTKLDTIDDFLDTEVAAIKAKTDNLPSDPADASDIVASFTTVNTKLDTIDDFLDTEVAAIKAKTDNLPSDPADQSAVEAAIAAARTVITDAITALNDLGQAEVAGAVWGAQTSSYPDVGSFGLLVAGLPTLAQLLAGMSVDSGTSSANFTAGQIILKAGSSAVDNFYQDLDLFIPALNFVGRIASYTGATRVAVYEHPTYTAAISGQTYYLLPRGRGTVGKLTVAALRQFFLDDTGLVYADHGTRTVISELVNGMWDELQVGHTSAGSFGLQMQTIANRFTTAMTESYAADGAAPTPAQILFMIWSAIAQATISGTTVSAKKLDGTTEAMTFTLDDDTNPTSRTRAS